MGVLLEIILELPNLAVVFIFVMVLFLCLAYAVGSHWTYTRIRDFEGNRPHWLVIVFLIIFWPVLMFYLCPFCNEDEWNGRN